MNPREFLQDVFNKIQGRWEQVFVYSGAVPRAAILGIAAFLAITAAVSPVEREREQASNQAAAGGEDAAPKSAFKEVDAEGTRTIAVASSDEPRFAVMGSSESENFFRSSYPSEFPNLAAAMSSRVTTWTGTESRVVRMYAPIRLQHTRIPRLEQLAQSDLDVDIVVISLPIYGLAHWTPPETDADELTSSQRGTARAFLALYENRPSKLLNAALANRFSAYKNRYQYSLAQFAPSAFAPVVFQIEDDTDNATPPATPPGDMNMITERVARIVREDTSKRNVELFMTRINQYAAQSDTRVLLVQMPLGLHLFSDADREDMADYAETFGNQIASRITTDSVRYLDLHAPAFVSEDEFRDPVHMLDFGGVADAIMAEAQTAGWLPPKKVD